MPKSSVIFFPATMEAAHAATTPEPMTVSDQGKGDANKATGTSGTYRVRKRVGADTSVGAVEQHPEAPSTAKGKERVEEEGEPMAEPDEQEEMILRVSQPLQDDGKRYPLSSIELRKAFARATIDLVNDHGFQFEEFFPESDVQQTTATGPYMLYSVAEKVLPMAKHFPTFVVEHSPKEGGSISINVHFKAMRLSDEHAKKYDATALNLASAKIIIYPEGPQEVRRISLAMYKKKFRDANFIVMSGSKQAVKFEGLMLGHDAVYHLNVRPIEGDFMEAKWPLLDFTLNAAKNFNSAFVIVRYKVFSGPNIDDKIFCTKKCHRKKPCLCDKNPQGKRKGPMPPPGGAKKRTKPDKGAGQSALLASMGLKITQPCPHRDGKCKNQRYGANACKFIHEDPPALIACKLEAVDSWCQNGKKCMYDHTEHTTDQAAYECQPCGMDTGGDSLL